MGFPLPRKIASLPVFWIAVTIAEGAAGEKEGFISSAAFFVVCHI